MLSHTTLQVTIRTRQNYLRLLNLRRLRLHPGRKFDLRLKGRTYRRDDHHAAR